MLKIVFFLLGCLNLNAEEISSILKVPTSKKINEIVSPIKETSENYSSKDQVEKNGDKYFKKINCSTNGSFEENYKKSWEFIGKTLKDYEEEFSSPEDKQITAEDVDEFETYADINYGAWLDCRLTKLMKVLRTLPGRNPSRNYKLCKCPTSNESTPSLINCGAKEPIINALTTFEYSSISSWSMSGIYQKINGALRSDEHDKVCQVVPIAREIMNGLEKLPSYKGVVYRGGSLPLKVEQEHQIGNVVEYTGFTSTTNDLKIANHFKNNGWLFIMNLNKSCHDIQSVSQGESEILCPPGIRFKVTNRDDSKREIFLVEVAH